MDEETKAEWEKSKRIDEERMKAARNLAHHEESKANQAFLTPEKAHGFSRDPDTVMASAERMANISIIFTILGIVFGIFIEVFSTVVEANHLGLAGGGIVMVFSALHSIGIGVGVVTGLVVLICAAFFGGKTRRNIKPAVITALISLALVALYYIVRAFVV